jgi:phage terminase large subunit
LIQLNRKYLPLIENNTRYFIITGGRGSAKSFSASLLFTKLCIEEPQRILFTRYTMVAAHLSIIPEFIEKIKLYNADNLFKINKTEIVNETINSSIIFKGIKTSSGDQTANLKSLQGVTTWVLDEAEELNDESTFDKIDFSIRTKGLQNRVVLIMNPSTKEHWIYKRFFEAKGVQEGFNGIKDDTTYIHTTYLDNYNNLDESFLKQVEQVKVLQPEKFKHIILGGWLNKAEGVIFTNWRIGEFDNTIPSVFGQDYGFSIDPSVLVNVAIDKSKRIIYVNECFCKPFMTTTDIEIENKRYAGDKLIIGDNSEGRLIEEIRRKGVNIKETVKIAVSSGIALMQDYEIVVTETSLNIIKELNNYSWSDKKSGTPIDLYNHCIDAIRYSVVYQLDNPNIKRMQPRGFGMKRN